MKSGMVEVWRGRNGQRKEKLSEAVDNVVELRAVKKREFYEERTGCKISYSINAQFMAPTNPYSRQVQSHLSVSSKTP